MDIGHSGSASVETAASTVTALFRDHHSELVRLALLMVATSQPESANLFPTVRNLSWAAGGRSHHLDRLVRLEDR